MLELDGYVGSDGSINFSTVTQARRRRDEVEDMARDFIATVTDVPVGRVIVHIVGP